LHAATPNAKAKAKAKDNSGAKNKIRIKRGRDSNKNRWKRARKIEQSRLILQTSFREQIGASRHWMIHKMAGKHVRRNGSFCLENSDRLLAGALLAKSIRGSASFQRIPGYSERISGAPTIKDHRAEDIRFAL